MLRGFEFNDYEVMQYETIDAQDKQRSYILLTSVFVLSVTRRSSIALSSSVDREELVINCI